MRVGVRSLSPAAFDVLEATTVVDSATCSRNEVDPMVADDDRKKERHRESENEEKRREKNMSVIFNEYDKSNNNTEDGRMEERMPHPGWSFVVGAAELLTVWKCGNRDNEKQQHYLRNKGQM